MEIVALVAMYWPDWRARNGAAFTIQLTRRRHVGHVLCPIRSRMTGRIVSGLPTIRYSTSASRAFLGKLTRGTPTSGWRVIRERSGNW